MTLLSSVCLFFSKGVGGCQCVDKGCSAANNQRHQDSVWVDETDGNPPPGLQPGHPHPAAHAALWGTRSCTVGCTHHWLFIHYPLKELMDLHAQVNTPTVPLWWKRVVLCAAGAETLMCSGGGEQWCLDCADQAVGGGAALSASCQRAEGHPNTQVSPCPSPVCMSDQFALKTSAFLESSADPSMLKTEKQNLFIEE